MIISTHFEARFTLSLNWKVGDEVSVSVKVTDDMVRKFAELSGDYNPIHLDDEYAKKTRFGRRIAHGMICGALISRVLAEKLGAGGIYLAQDIKFKNPVYIDDTVTITLKVLNIRESKGIASIDTTCRTQNGDIAVKGEATIMMARSVQAQPTT
jgi:acyl dehydratase